MTAADLLDWMFAKQAALGLTNQEFMQRVGLTPQLFRFFVLRERGPGLNTLRLLLRAFPEDRDAILSAVELGPLRDEEAGREE